MSARRFGIFPGLFSRWLFSTSKAFGWNGYRFGSHKTAESINCSRNKAISSQLTASCRFLSYPSQDMDGF